MQLGNPVIRNVLAKNVATANEGPNSAPVFPHSEFGWSSNYPSAIVFFCRVAAEEGGETPINTTTESFARLQAEVPEFIEELAAKVRFLSCPSSKFSCLGSSNLHFF